jgi:hypothetical protein
MTVSWLLECRHLFLIGQIKRQIVRRAAAYVYTFEWAKVDRPLELTHGEPPAMPYCENAAMSYTPACPAAGASGTLPFTERAA